MQLVRIKGTGFGVYRRSDDGRYVVKYKDDRGVTRNRKFERAGDANEYCRKAYREWSGRTEGVDYTVTQLVDDYLAERFRPTYLSPHTGKPISAATRALDVEAAKRIRAYFPRAQAADVGEDGVTAWLDAMRDEVADHTRSNYAKTLRGAYKYAARPGGPLRGVANPVPSVPIGSYLVGRALSADTLRAIVAAIRPEYRTFVSTLAFSGMRIGEVCALDVVSLTVDPDTGIGYLFGGSKTDAGRDRSVAIPVWLVDQILASLEGRTEGPLFVNLYGGRITPGGFRNRQWKVALEAAGVDVCKPHWLRHTLATMLAASHHSTYELQSHFGWKDARTASRYVHAAKTGVPAIAETLSTGGGGGAYAALPRRSVMSSESTCTNCGEPIVYREAPPPLDPSESYWTHSDKPSNWCYDPTGYLSPDIPPERLHLRAQPVEDG